MKFFQKQREVNELYGLVRNPSATGPRWRLEFLAAPEGEAWRNWRDAKLEKTARFLTCAPVSIADPRLLSQAEKDALHKQIALANMALYHWRRTPADADALDLWLLDFSSAFGLRAVEDHRSANRNGVVRIEVAKGGRGFYIPYTDRPISWHTDGYYNYHGAARSVQAMILHCAESAEQGGENRLIDHELAFLRLAETDRAALALLTHPEAMIIPETTDEDGKFRGENRGPVFFLTESGALAMRYTARKKYVEWRNAATREAAATLLALLEFDPLVRRERLEPGQGLLCNNVLHDRAAFSNGAAPRLFCRIRFHNRIETEA